MYHEVVWFFFVCVCDPSVGGPMLYSLSQLARADLFVRENFNQMDRRLMLSPFWRCEVENLDSGM